MKKEDFQISLEELRGKWIDDFNNEGNDFKQKSHFEDLPKTVTCKDREHTPPSYLYIPPGKVYVHICPSCGRELRLRGSSATY